VGGGEEYKRPLQTEQPIAKHKESPLDDRPTLK
jgi:hypothetical protein